MAVLVILEIEASSDDYDKANAKIDAASNPPDGLVVHTAEETGGKMRIVDVWESAGQFESFSQERVGPAVAEALGDDAPSPSVEIRELHNMERF
ncbi:hypothetical protein BH20ACT15_BH20ACT15_14720 [soil metagenome]